MMTNFVIVVLLFVILYFYDKSKNEEKLRDKNEINNNLEKDYLDRRIQESLKESIVLNLIIEIESFLIKEVSAIKDQDVEKRKLIGESWEGYYVSHLSVRQEKLTFFVEIKEDYLKKDSLIISFNIFGADEKKQHKFSPRKREYNEFHKIEFEEFVSDFKIIFTEKKNDFDDDFDWSGTSMF